MRGLFIVVLATTACGEPAFITAPDFIGAGTVVFWQDTDDPNKAQPRWFEHDGQNLLVGNYPIESGGPVTALHYACDAESLGLPGQLVLQPGAGHRWAIDPNQVFELQAGTFQETTALGAMVRSGLRNTNWEQPDLCEARTGPNRFTPIALPSTDHINLAVLARLDEGVFLAADNSISFLVNSAFDVMTVEAPPNLRAGYRGENNTLFVVDKDGVVFHGHPFTGFTEFSRGASIPERIDDLRPYQIEMVGSPSGDELYIATQSDLQVLAPDGWRQITRHSSWIIGLAWLRPGTAAFVSKDLITFGLEGAEATELQVAGSFMTFLDGVGHLVSTSDSRVLLLAEDGSLERVDAGELEADTFLIPLRGNDSGGIVFGRVRQGLTEPAIWYPDSGLCEGSGEYPATAAGYAPVTEDSIVIATQSSFGRKEAFQLLRFDHQNAPGRCGEIPP